MHRGCQSGTPDLGGGAESDRASLGQQHFCRNLHLRVWLCLYFQAPYSVLLQACPSGTHQNPHMHPKRPRFPYFCYIMTRFQTVCPQEISCPPPYSPAFLARLLPLAPLRTKPHQHRPGTWKVPLSWFPFWSRIHPVSSGNPPKPT